LKGAIANVEIYLFENAGPPKRLSLTIAAPERSAVGGGWECRVALADLHRPETLEGADSFEALGRAMDRARSWVADLRRQGHALARDRAGECAFEWD
jgi:hypothetical protein